MSQNNELVSAPEIYVDILMNKIAAINVCNVFINYVYLVFLTISRFFFK